MLKYSLIDKTTPNESVLDPLGVSFFRIIICFSATALVTRRFLSRNSLGSKSIFSRTKPHTATHSLFRSNFHSAASRRISATACFISAASHIALP
ncbi:MAG: hypothetical protein II305_04205, partial [Clostridia bacterium]|nr:hypothetical protein [Clostridia bacterium]